MKFQIPTQQRTGNTGEITYNKNKKQNCKYPPLKQKIRDHYTFPEASDIHRTFIWKDKNVTNFRDAP